MGTLHWWCFKSNRYLIRHLEKCLLSTSGLALRKSNGLRCHVRFSMTEDEFLGRCFWVGAPPRLDAHTWIQFLLALLSTGSGSPCVVPVPTKQHVGAPGFPRSAALRGVHGSVAPISGTGTFSSSEKVLNAT